MSGPQPPVPRRTSSLGCLGVFALFCLVLLTAAEAALLWRLNPQWFDRHAYWRGPILEPDVLPVVNTPLAEPAPAPPPAPGSLPAPGDWAVDWASLSVTTSASTTMSRARGGSVELPDGTRLEVPPGALPEDRAVTLRRLAAPGPAWRGMTITDVDTGGVTLRADATLTVPFPPQHPALAKQKREYKAFHHHGGVATELPVQVDPDRCAMRVQAREFSPIVVLGVLVASELWLAKSHLAEELLALVARNPCDPPLEVPYCFQGHANWCWAASTVMMLKAHGKNADPWHLAANFHSGFLDALSDPQGHWRGRLNGLYTREGLRPDLSAVPWLDPAEALLYACERLQSGQPVYLSIYKQQHAVVLVGYNRTGLFVHDPSGHFLERAGLGPAAQFLAQGRVAAALVPWDSFLGACHIAGLPGFLYTGVVTNVAATPQPVSIMLLHDDLRFTHPTPRPLNQRFPWKVVFTWDGTAPGGSRWSAVPQSPIWPDVAADSANAFPNATPVHACNSDRMWLRVVASNAGARAQDVEVSAKLGGWPVGKPRTVTLPPYRALERVDLTPTPPGAAARRGTLAGLPMPTRYTPGDQVLVVEAKVAGRVVDYVTVDLKVGPSRPANVRFDVKNDKLCLRWDAAPEQDVGYSLYRVAGRPDASPQYHGSTPDTDYPLSPDDKSGDPIWYYVVTRHSGSDLSSSPSDFAELNDPFVGQWSGSIYLVEGELAAILKKLMRDHLAQLDQEEQTRIARIEDPADRQQEKQKWEKQKKEVALPAIELVEATADSLEWVARAFGVPLTFEISKDKDNYFFRPKTFLLLDVSADAPAVPLQRVAPVTMEFMQESQGSSAAGPAPVRAGSADADAATPLAIPLPPLKLHRWNQITGEHAWNIPTDGKTTRCRIRWAFTRAEAPHP